MRASRRIGRLLVVTTMGFGLVARAQSPQETKRQNILDELGLKKKPPAAPAAPPAPAAEPATEEQKPEAPGGKAKSGGRTAVPAGPSFTRAIHPLFLATCKACHTAGGAAAATPLVLTGDAEADHRVLERLADVRAPEASKLLQKASGTALHGGGAPWPTTSGPYERVLAWIRAGARLDRAAARVEAAAPAPDQPAGRHPGDRHETRTPVAATVPATPPPPTAGASAPVVPAAADTSAAAVPAAAAPAPPLAASVAAGPTFATTVHPVLMGVCAACHRAGGPAGMTRFLLSGDVARDEAVVRPLVDAQAPESSLLVTKASGQMHAGGAPLPPGDPRRTAIVGWIAGLAAPPPVAVAAPNVPGAPAAPATAPIVVVAAPPPAPPPPGAGPPPGLPLPLGFMLNGRFDLNYERRHFTGNPWDDASVAGLRSYHHFLFLTRDAGDPCGLTVEVLTLLFWEGHCRLPRRLGPVAVTLAGGKIVVPFGADPLFHQSYGGLAGFDQVVLPPVWAIEGAAAHAVLSRRELVFTDDLFVVRGYALGHPDSVISLQSDFSPDDHVRLAVGNRIGAAWRGISAWYSLYFNPLGFGRQLFMQAIDVNIWRPRQIPVLGHFSLGAGLLRADVSGGGPGVGGVGYDYYDFADYLQLRYYPLDWLFLQYRTGLFTFNNRRGMVVDNSRLTSADGSTHNFGIVARTRNLWFGIFYFINLEKVNEVSNDLLRLNVTYEF
jgi:cytochrome c553